MPEIFVGSVLRNNQGSEFVIEKIEGRMKVSIRYLDIHGHASVEAATLIKLGSIKNPYQPKIYGVGFMGVGPFRSAIGSIRTPEYEAWKAMMSRAYDKSLHARNPAYIGCSVCPEWHNFQNFAAWLNDQPNWGRSGFELDKDVTKAGNKTYGPEFCELLPRRINALRMTPKGREGLPPGVSISPNGKYRAQCRDGSVCVKLGTHDTKEDAFMAYKVFKEGVIREAADEFRSVISDRVYKSMISHEVTP